MKIMTVGHIDIATKWRKLGPELLVNSYNVMQEIEANHRYDVSTCCRIMFEKWLDMKPGASWDELVTGLNNIEMRTAADFISKQFKSGSEHTVQQFYYLGQCNNRWAKYSNGCAGRYN